MSSWLGCDAASKHVSREETSRSLKFQCGRSTGEAAETLTLTPGWSCLRSTFEAPDAVVFGLLLVSSSIREHMGVVRVISSLCDTTGVPRSAWGSEKECSVDVVLCSQWNLLFSRLVFHNRGIFGHSRKPRGSVQTTSVTGRGAVDGTTTVRKCAETGTVKPR